MPLFAHDPDCEFDAPCRCSGMYGLNPAETIEEPGEGSVVADGDGFHWQRTSGPWWTFNGGTSVLWPALMKSGPLTLVREGW